MRFFPYDVCKCRYRAVYLLSTLTCYCSTSVCATISLRACMRWLIMCRDFVQVPYSRWREAFGCQEPFADERLDIRRGTERKAGIIGPECDDDEVLYVLVHTYMYLIYPCTHTHTCIISTVSQTLRIHSSSTVYCTRVHYCKIRNASCYFRRIFIHIILHIPVQYITCIYVTRYFRLRFPMFAK